MFNWVPTNPWLRSLRLVAVGAALLIGYVLSPMPVTKFCEATKLNQVDGFDEFFTCVWYPLLVLCKNFDAVEIFYEAYESAYDSMSEAVTRIY